MRLLIRSFVQADQAETRQLILEGLGGHFGFIDESMNPDLDDIHSHYLEAGGDFVVAVLAGEIVGTGALVKESEWAGRLVRMSVKETCRRQGIGTSLVAYLLGLAERRGFHQLLVETNLDWHDAIGLYAAHGFLEYDRDEVSTYMGLDLVRTRADRQ